MKDAALYSRHSSRKQPSHRLRTEVENTFYIPLHPGPMRETPDPRHRKCVRHPVSHHRAAGLALKDVFMIPKCVRARQCPVNKSPRRIPLRDFRRPPNRHPVPPQAVVDQGSSLQDWWRFDHTEVKPRRSNPLQILWSREKLENLVDRPTQPLFSVQHIRVNPAGIHSVGNYQAS
jgi:hypothetical protein